MALGRNEIDRIETVSSAVGNWYRVKGTPDEPQFDRVALWAVVSLAWRDGDTGEVAPSTTQAIVGLPASEIGVMGAADFDEWMVGVAGYVELSDDDYSAILEKPIRITGYENLVWA